MQCEIAVRKTEKQMTMKMAVYAVMHTLHLCVDNNLQNGSKKKTSA